MAVVVVVVDLAPDNLGSYTEVGREKMGKGDTCCSRDLLVAVNVTL